MSRRIALRPAAENDIADQFAWYLEHATSEVAERFLSAVWQTFDLLLGAPEIGAPDGSKHPLLANLRMFVVHDFSKHLVFYLPVEDGIEIVRVLSGRRDTDAILAAE